MTEETNIKKIINNQFSIHPLVPDPLVISLMFDVSLIFAAVIP